MKTPASTLLCVNLAFLELMFASAVQAASSTFTGASSVNWNVTGNWLSGVLPGVGDDLIIQDTTVNNSVTLNDASHTNGLIQLGTSGTRNAAFTINGSSTGTSSTVLTITNGVLSNYGAGVGSGNLIIKTPVIVQGDQTWAVTGTVPASTTDYGLVLTVGANGTQRPLTLNGTITKTGSGEVVLIGQNVGNGNIVVNQGWLKINAGSSTTVTVGGTGAITVNNGATFMLAKNSGTLIVTKAINLNNGATFRLGGNSGTLNTVGSLITFNGNVPIIADYASLLLDFTNIWSGTVTSTITGNGGTINLWADNSALSGTINNNGTFKMRFGSSDSASPSVAWGLNNAAAYYEIYGSATNINLGSLGGTSGIMRNSNTNNLPATATVGFLNTSTTFGGVIADNTAALGLIKVGSGTLTLSGTNTYSGATVVSNGTITLLAGALGSGPVSVGGGTTLSGNGTASGAVTVNNNAVIEADGGAGSPPLNVGSLTLGTGGSDLTTTRVNPYLGGKIVSGALTVNGTNIINILGAAPAVGVYDLITYAGGSIGGAGFAGIQLGALPYGVVATLQNSGTAVQLNVTAVTVESGIWVGNVLSTWNQDGTLDWKGATSGNPQPYHDLYPVFFDDSATSFAVNITTNVTPASIGVINSTHAYTWSGAGGIVGAIPLNKGGSGTLVIANSNNYSAGTFITNGVVQVGNGSTNGLIIGPVMDNGSLVFNRSDSIALAGAISGTGTIEQRGPGALTLTGNNSFTGIATVTAGTLVVGSGTALGDTNANTVVANGATLDINAQNLGPNSMEPIAAQGAGVGGIGAIVNNLADNQNSVRYVTLNGPTTFGGGFRWDIRDPASSAVSSGVNAYLVGNGYPLTKVGSNIVAFINIGETGLGDINVQQGTLTISRSTTAGNPANKINVFPGATFQLHRTSEFIQNIVNKVLGMTNATFAIESNGLTNEFAGAITLTGTNNVNIPTSATGLILEGPVGGTGSLLVNNSGGLFCVSNSAAHAGGTIINGGTLQVDGTLGTGTNPLLLTNATVSGSGTIADAVTLTAGNTLAPGDAGIGMLTFGKPLVLAAGSTSRFEINKDLLTNDMAAVSGSVIYGGNLILTNLGSTAYAPGDSFKLFNGASYSGAFTSISPATPSLGLLWMTNSLLVDGTLKVIVVPTPNPPVVIGASALLTNVISVIFNMQVDQTTAENLSSYSLNTTNGLVSATLLNGTNVQLVLDSALTATNYVLHVQNVKNLAYIPDNMAATNVTGKLFGFEQAYGVLTVLGSAFAVGNEMHVVGSGADIFGASDSFEFVYLTVTNDFDYSVCLHSFGQSDPAAKAGLMAREINDPSASPDAERNVIVESFPPPPGRNQCVFQFRDPGGAATVALAAPRPDSTYPSNWFRLQRVGSVFTGYVSSDNANWTLMYSMDSATNVGGAYGSAVGVGLAVTSHNAALSNEAVFSDFGVTPISVPISVALAGNDVVLSWPSAGLGMTLQATPNFVPPVVWTNVPGSTTTNLIQIPIGPGASFFRLTH